MVELAEIKIQVSNSREIVWEIVHNLSDLDKDIFREFEYYANNTKFRKPEQFVNYLNARIKGAICMTLEELEEVMPDVAQKIVSLSRVEE